MPSYLEQSIFNTVRYFSIHGTPATATHIWRSLVIPPPTSTLRWDGHQAFSLREVEEALAASAWLRTKLATHWGYYYLQGQAALVEQFLQRHRVAQDKWKLVRQVARYLVYLPFVDMIAVSGSLALGNTKPTSDLDLFIVARHQRIWTARALLLGVTQLLGRRRKHWDRQAPDKVCLNHYVTDRTLAIDLEIRNLFTAISFMHIVPLYGQAVFQQFQATNEGWYKRFLMYPPAPLLASVHAVHIRNLGRRFKRQVELLEPLGDWLEHFLERIQRLAIARHSMPGRSGRVVVTNGELAFHPDSKVEGILAQFSQDQGQQALW